MDGYDSDSSVAESNVLLGYLDGPIKSTRDLHDWRSSRVGGSFLSAPVAVPQIACLSCSGKMALAAQVYAPLENTAYERVLYVFLCRKCEAKCARAFRAVFDRTQDVDVESAPQPAPLLGSSIFGASSLGAPVGGAAQNPFAARSPASKPAKESVRVEPPQVTAQVDNVEPQYIATSAEYLPTSKDRKSHSKDEHQVGSAEKGEAFEVQSVRGLDRTSLAFFERLWLSDQEAQAIRYSTVAPPLFYSDRLRKENTTASFSCAACGAALRHEIQLMPVLVDYVRRPMDGVKDKARHLMSVLVYTCSADCHADEDWKEESIFLEWE